MNFYLLIIGILLIILSLRLNCKSKFTPMNIPDIPLNSGIPQPSNGLPPIDSNFIQPYELDSRYIFPYNPPVNPMVFNSLTYEAIPVQQDLFGPGQEGNELEYSGGTTELVKIPLQYNMPYNEALRTQDILITPYNRIKYSTRDPSSYK
jgi:hypothetical protein